MKDLHGYETNEIAASMDITVVIDCKSVNTTAAIGSEYNNSRLHVTYLTFPLLLETALPLGKHASHVFINGGIVLKTKTDSSSKVWKDVDRKEQKTKIPGDLNLRSVTFDIIDQAGFNDYGVFASYSPLSLFLNNKGAKGNQVAFGF